MRRVIGLPGGHWKKIRQRPVKATLDFPIGMSTGYVRSTTPPTLYPTIEECRLSYHSLLAKLIGVHRHAGRIPIISDSKSILQAMQEVLRVIWVRKISEAPYRRGNIAFTGCSRLKRYWGKIFSDRSIDASS